mgnify:FL=1|jgi:putative sigma-54 modulation protein
MKVNTQSVNFVADQSLVDFVQKKMDRLDQFFDKVICADIYMKVENKSEKDNKIFEAKITVPGDSYIVKKKSKTFEDAADMASQSLERLLKKRKEKLRAHA